MRDDMTPEALAQAISESASGSKDASFRLAEHYHQSGDYRAAEAYYRKSLDQGFLSAAATLAHMLGEIGESSRALAWLDAACRGGDGIACVRLSHAYDFGDEALGVRRDRTKSSEYVSLAEHGLWGRL